MDIDNKQNRITVNFRLTSQEEQKLYNWIKQKGVIVGDSGVIKLILYKAYQEEQQHQENK